MFSGLAEWLNRTCPFHLPAREQSVGCIWSTSLQGLGECFQEEEKHNTGPTAESFTDPHGLLSAAQGCFTLPEQEAPAPTLDTQPLLRSTVPISPSKKGAPNLPAHLGAF